MARVVLDTNVWVSAFISPGGACDDAIHSLLVGRVELVTSRWLAGELRKVLMRKVGMTAQEADAAVAWVLTVCRVVEPTERVHAISAKDDDNRVLECALAGEADLIVSGDTRHLLPLRSFRGIPIVSPRSVLDQPGLR